MLDVSSTAKGFLAPRMTAEQKAAITSPATGLLVYQTDAPAGYYYYSGTPASPSWVQLGAASGASQWTTTGSNIYYNTGNVGIGTTTPAYKLDVTTTANNFGISHTDGTVRVGTWVGTTGLITIGQFGTFSNHPLGFFTNGAAPNMVILQNGNVGIGTTAPSRTLYVNGTSGGTNAWENLSDKRLKKDVLSIENGLDKVMALRPITFNWNKTVNPELKLDDRNHLGFIAQEVEAVLPQVVSTADDAMKTKSVAYSDIVPVLTKAIQEQQTTIEAQQKTNEAQQKTNEAQQIQIDELKKMVEILMKKQDPAKVKQLN